MSGALSRRMRHAVPRSLPTGENPYLAAPARVMLQTDLVDGVRLYDLRFIDPGLAERFDWKPGQFVMLSVLGVGEAPFSLPSSPTRRGVIQLAIREAGAVTGYLFDHVKEGDLVGIRGPLGNGFPVEKFFGQDLLLVAGGLGMVPLRGLLQFAIDHRERFGRILLLYGARSPEQVLFRGELTGVERRGDAEIHLAIERATTERWGGRVGLVTDLLDAVSIDVGRTYAVACGPPVFYKHVLDRLVGLGFSKDRVYMTLERRMECGIGKCGHCAVGYTMTCLDGPVFSLWDALNLPELIYT